jgi:AcrR family transcriptional regulator
MLADDGPDALALRRVAADVGVSTRAVYDLFGSKQKLLEAMFIEGFARLGAAFDAVPVTQDPVEDLLALGLAYRRAVLENPHLYELMFGHPVPGFRPAPEVVQATLKSFDILVKAIDRCAHDQLSDVDPRDAAMVLHGLVHGLVSLELRWGLGAPDEADRRWNTALSALTDGLGLTARTDKPL